MSMYSEPSCSEHKEVDAHKCCGCSSSSSLFRLELAVRGCCERGRAGSVCSFISGNLNWHSHSSGKEGDPRPYLGFGLEQGHKAEWCLSQIGAS